MSCREIKSMMDEAGFTIRRETGSHIIWEKADKVITTSRSASDRRALMNIRADIRRATKGESPVWNQNRNEAAQQREPERRVVGTNLGDVMKSAGPVGGSTTLTNVKVPTHNEASQLLVQWFNEGVLLNDMSRRLEAMNYVGTRGRALDGSGCRQRLAAMGFTRRGKNKKRSAAVARPKEAPTERAAPKSAPAAAHHVDRLDAVKAILNLSSHSADDRIAMALLIIG